MLAPPASLRFPKGLAANVETSLLVPLASVKKARRASKKFLYH
jgi:hypothetical protein